MRVISKRPANPTIGPYAPRTAMTIVIDDARIQGTDPYVAGFTLVGRREITGTLATEYKFEPSSEGDPYVPCLVPIPNTRRRKLVEAYRYIGMSRLADMVEQSAELTVEDLKEYISQETTYPYPDVGTGQSGGDERIEMFRSHVENGRLVEQCTGSAVFLKCSIDVAFGHGHATVVRGGSLPMENETLMAARHAQVATNLAGRKYILDSTPNGGDTLRGGIAPRATGRDLLDREPPVSGEEFKARVAKLQLASTTVQGQKALIDELTHFFRARNKDHLDDMIVRLGEDDPILRSMRHFHMSRKYGRLEMAELDKTLWFIDALLTDKNPDAARKLGWSRYPPWILHLTQQELVKLRAAYGNLRAADL